MSKPRIQGDPSTVSAAYLDHRYGPHQIEAMRHFRLQGLQDLYAAVVRRRSSLERLVYLRAIYDRDLFSIHEISAAGTYL